jgi:hypothetical protein
MPRPFLLTVVPTAMALIAGCAPKAVANIITRILMR